MAAGQVPAALPDELVAEHTAALEQAYAGAEAGGALRARRAGGAAERRRGARRDRRAARPAARRSTTRCRSVPAGFTVHKKLERGRERRTSMLADARRAHASTGPPPRSWRSRRSSPTASPIRLTGEDVERGTFSHRHAVLHDAVTGDRHVPLQRCRRPRAAFEIHNSPLSELAVIGFELGYNLQEPTRLVIWEAQYGDFINGAQAILDEFLMSGRAKWGMAPSLVLLLPHGYEGQGPDHSSARRRAVPAAGGRHERAHRQLHDGGAVLPRAAAPGRCCSTPTRCRSSC